MLGFHRSGLPTRGRRRKTFTVSNLAAKKTADKKGFGTPPPHKKTKKSKRPSLSEALQDNPTKSQSQSSNRPYVKSEQDQLLRELQARASRSVLGRAVAAAAETSGGIVDDFWLLMPSLIASRFPTAKDEDLQRVAGFLRHALDPSLPLEDEIVNDPWRPQDEIHAYMPGLGPTTPFRDPSQLELCRQLSANYEAIASEYRALVEDMAREGGVDRFQSVTSMNYDAGWRTLVLFYNGHRIPGFPYHLCPVTTRLLEAVPLAGRIAGFNRQQPLSGIPLHSDGNNMWLTCQMGIHVPPPVPPGDRGDESRAWIRVGPERRHWEEGGCLLYDTTYEHETYNPSPTQERVVLHVDFFNTLAMTPTEIQVMQYIYSLREEFMKAEGVSKVGAQIL
jgi:aspartyl/asparaginyl beta-hydroxylase (cupin superfamily)